MSCISEALMLDMSLWDFVPPKGGEKPTLRARRRPELVCSYLIPHDVLTLNQADGFRNKRGILMVTGVISRRQDALSGSQSLRRYFWQSNREQGSIRRFAS